MSTPVTLDFSNGWYIDAAPGSGPAKAAAHELAEHLALIAPQSEGQSGIRMSLAYRDQATDGFIWNVAEGHVQLTGNSERGLLYAIFSFLTQLGFGWPGHEPDDRCIPSGLRFSLPEACAETPSFEGRCLIIGHHVFLAEHEAWIRWAARNCLNTVFVHTAEEGLALGLSLIHISDHGILGEEYGLKEGPSPISWIIDPIDGTRVFMSGLPTWGTLIGAMHNTVPVVGVMDQPYTGERFFGGPSGAKLITRDGEQPMKCRSCESLSNAVLGATDPRMFAQSPDKDVFRTLSDSVKLLRYGGDCYNYAMVALGQMDLVVEAHNQAYDILPLVPIVEAAGGIVTDWAGRPLRSGADFDRSKGKMIAAGDKRIHEAAVKILSSAA